MKKLNILLVLFSALTFFNSCNSDEESEPLTTKLELTVKDNTENIVPNATVKLYSTLTDLNNQTNQIGATQHSDIDGKVTFNNLSAQNYFWLAENECSNNINGVFMTSEALTPNITNVLTTDISGTGTLKFVNDNSTQIEIILNATDHYFIEGGMTFYIYNRKSGEEIGIEILRPGYVYFHPSFTLECGETKEIVVL